MNLYKNRFLPLNIVIQRKKRLQIYIKFLNKKDFTSFI